MRVVLTVIFAAALLPLAAQAQVTVQDQADTFLSERQNYQARIDANPQKWWNGDISDNNARRAASNNGAYNMVPGNPLTVAPLFSMEEMLAADSSNAGPQYPSDPGSYQASPDSVIPRNPGDLAPQDIPLSDEAAARVNAAFGDNSSSTSTSPSPSQDLSQPFGASESIPEIAPPPVQDEDNAVFVDPADAPAAGEEETLSPDTTRNLP